MNALVPVAPPSLPDHSGPALYRVSTDAAALCRDIVLATSSTIQGRKYVAVEGWQSIALAHGCAASSGDVVRLEDGSVSATGRVVRIDTGRLISSAEGYVGADETTWFGGSVTDKWGKTKILPKRPDYAIRAMAQTRAISRACRSAFAHVVVMMNVGLSTTPAEEVPDEGFERSPRTPALNAPETKPLSLSPGEWLQDLASRLAEAPDAEWIARILEDPPVQLAKAKFKNGLKEQLDVIVREAEYRAKRMAPPPTPHVPATGKVAADDLDDEIPF